MEVSAMKDNLKTDFLMAMVVAGIHVVRCEKAILCAEFQHLITKFSKAQSNHDLRQQSFCLFSSLLLKSLNFLQKSFCLRIGLKMPSHWLNKFVNGLSNSWFQVIGMKKSFREVFLKFFIRIEDSI